MRWDENLKNIRQIPWFSSFINSTFFTKVKIRVSKKKMMSYSSDFQMKGEAK